MELHRQNSYGQKQGDLKLHLQNNHLSGEFYLQVCFHTAKPAVCKENQKATPSAAGIQQLGSL